jgi:hypothetical protein
MKRITWLIFVSFALLYSACAAAQADLFVRSLCVPEYGFVKYDEVSFEIDSEVATGQINTIEEKHGLFELGDYGLPDKPAEIEKICKLGQITVKAKFKYIIPGHGPCGASPWGKLNLWVNEKPIIKDVSFGVQCFGYGIGVRSVSVNYNSKHTWVNIEYEHDKSISAGYAAEISEHLWFINDSNLPVTMDLLNKEAARVKAIYKAAKKSE